MGLKKLPMNIITKPVANTDNKGKLACHGFCKEVPATKTVQK